MDETGTKAALRRKFSALRKAITPEERQKYDARICRAISDLPQFREADTTAAFYSFGAEPDLSPLFHSKKLLLPRFVEAAGCYELAFVENIERDLLPGKYGILEPRPEIPAVPMDFIASRVLFLIPAVACDRRGVRLGRGGGFYDRMLSGVKKPPVAVVYSCQLSGTALPGDAHDVPVGTIVTEREVIFCRERSYENETTGE